MRQVSAVLAIILLGGATGAVAQEGVATELRTVTTGQCDGRSASLDVMRGDTASAGSVETVLDGRRIRMEPIISARLLEAAGPMDVTISCTSTDVTFQVEIQSTQDGGRRAQNPEPPAQLRHAVADPGRLTAAGGVS